MTLSELAMKNDLVTLAGVYKEEKKSWGLFLGGRGKEETGGGCNH